MKRPCRIGETFIQQVRFIGFITRIIPECMTGLKELANILLM